MDNQRAPSAIADDKKPLVSMSLHETMKRESNESQQNVRDKSSVRSKINLCVNYIMIKNNEMFWLKSMSIGSVHYHRQQITSWHVDYWNISNVHIKIKPTIMLQSERFTTWVS